MFIQVFQEGIGWLVSVLIIRVRVFSVLLHSLLHFGPSTADRLRQRINLIKPLYDTFQLVHDLTSDWKKTFIYPFRFVEKILANVHTFTKFKNSQAQNVHAHNAQQTIVGHLLRDSERRVSNR